MVFCMSLLMCLSKDIKNCVMKIVRYYIHKVLAIKAKAAKRHENVLLCCGFVCKLMHRFLFLTIGKYFINHIIFVEIAYTKLLKN